MSFRCAPRQTDTPFCSPLNSKCSRFECLPCRPQFLLSENLTRDLSSLFSAENIGEMFIHNSVITLMPEPILSVSMCGKQLKSDWVNCVVTGCQTSSSAELCLDRCLKHVSKKEEGIENATSMINVGAGTSSGSSNPENIDARLKSEKLNLVYHRRKQRVICDDLSVHSGSPFLTEQNRAHSQVRESCGEDLSIDGKRSILEVGSSGKNDFVLMSELHDYESLGLVVMPNSTNDDSVKRELVYKRKSDSECCVSAHGSCFSSKPHIRDLGLSSSKSDADISGECSSSVIGANEVTFKPYSESEIGCSAQLCCVQDDPVLVNGHDVSKSCKMCNYSDSPLNMLICDFCNEAFHLSCCNPEVTKIKFDEWFCAQCQKKKPKRLLEVTKRGKPTRIIKGISGYKKKLRSGSSLISFMLEGTEPYDSGVRIGEAFQAEVLEWSGPIFSDTDSYGQLDEVNPVEYMKLHGWNSILSAKQKSIGNWLQCREVICDNTKDIPKEIVCGKWRRAPLFELQTEDWDCSCSVLWDPVHADCAVPQEASTEEVMMHLKYVKLVCPHHFY